MQRDCGVLLHVSSLWGPYGIGTMGGAAYRFVDFLQKAGVRYWQVLPMNPTSYGDSPYQSPSVFAGNPYFVDLDLLAAEGLLKRAEYENVDFGSGNVDYEKLFTRRYPVLRLAYARFRASLPEDYAAFNAENDWLDGYCTYMALKERFGYRSFDTWEDWARFSHREELAAFRLANAGEIGFWGFLQYEFAKQWTALKAYANERGVEFIGDMPIYTAYDSADVWARPALFLLDETLLPTAVAGVPPDCFSADGQLWGNPLYDWEAMERDGFSWWVSRIRQAAKLYDLVRIDHFRGFAGYYTVPFGSASARDGAWRKGPGMRLFEVVKREAPHARIIAEDLGLLDDDVRALLAATGYPGMKVLQFGFGGGEDNEYYPPNVKGHCVAYTGTHDNATTNAWYAALSPEEKRLFKKGTGYTARTTPARALIRAAYATGAETAVVPMQDWLDLPASGRMNTPSTLANNWVWRMAEGDASPALCRRMRKLAEQENRAR